MPVIYKSYCLCSSATHLTVADKFLQSQYLIKDEDLFRESDTPSFKVMQDIILYACVKNWTVC